MARKVVWASSAYKDLQRIVEYISEDSIYYAMSFYESVMDKAQTLESFPHRGRVVPEKADPTNAGNFYTQIQINLSYHG